MAELPAWFLRCRILPSCMAARFMQLHDESLRSLMLFKATLFQCFLSPYLMCLIAMFLPQERSQSAITTGAAHRLQRLWGAPVPTAEGSHALRQVV